MGLSFAIEIFFYDCNKVSMYCRVSCWCIVLQYNHLYVTLHFGNQKLEMRLVLIQTVVNFVLYVSVHIYS